MSLMLMSRIWGQKH